MTEQSKTCPERQSKIQNLKSDDSAKCAGAGGQSDQMTVLSTE